MQVLDKVKSYFKKEPFVPEPTGRRLDFTNGKLGWGWNVMSFHQKEDHTMTCLVIGGSPQVGDELLINMQSGKTGICRVLKSEWQTDPADMYKVRFGIVDYLEDEKPNAD